MENVEKAYRAWKQAENVFNNAETREDIDFAVYNLEAKKKQYLKLLAQEREKNGAE